MDATGALLAAVGVVFVAGALPFYALAFRSALRLALRGGTRAEWAGAAVAGIAWLASLFGGTGLIVVGALLRDGLPNGPSLLP
jgi:hypothetical protein